MPLGKLKDMRQMREINPALLVAERGERGQERSEEGNDHLGSIAMNGESLKTREIDWARPLH
jgi:hypothetical protein